MPTDLADTEDSSDAEEKRYEHAYRETRRTLDEAIETLAVLKELETERMCGTSSPGNASNSTPSVWIWSARTLRSIQGSRLWCRPRQDSCLRSSPCPRKSSN